MQTMMMAIVLAGMVAAGEGAGAPRIETKPAGGKDWCLLDSTKCEQHGYPLLEKIERLKAAIAQGTAVYSPDELVRLEKKLREAEEASELIQG